MLAPKRQAVLLAGLLLAAAPASAAGPACMPDQAADALWTVADVDGDRAAELVRVAAATTRPVDPEVFEAGCRVETASAVARVLHGTLGVQDLDADRDLDLVHFDAAGTLVRAWLNDGRGRFRTVAPGVARGRAPRSSYQSSTSSPSPLLTVWHAPRDRTPGDVESLRTAIALPRASARAVVLVQDAIPFALRAPGPRAPPLSSPAIDR